MSSSKAGRTRNLPIKSSLGPPIDARYAAAASASSSNMSVGVGVMGSLKMKMQASQE